MVLLKKKYFYFNRICEGIKSPVVVLREQIAKYKEVFIKTTEQVYNLFIFLKFSSCYLSCTYNNIN